MNHSFRIIYILTFFIFSIPSFSQIDYSEQWEDFFSYNNVIDFVKIDHLIYAISDNASFIYDTNSKEIEKKSSVHGLSGKETSSIHYNRENNRFIIGYKSGLIEIIDEKGQITISNDIERLDITGQKSVNHIAEHNNFLYLSTPFGIVQYDIENLVFGDTYYIDQNSNPVYVNQTLIFENVIYAATLKGIYSADINNPNLIDFNNWKQPQGDLLGDFKSIKSFENKVFCSKENGLYFLETLSSLTQVKSFEPIVDLQSSSEYLTISTEKKAYVLDNSLNQVFEAGQTEDRIFGLNTAFSDSKNIYLATSKYGILQNNLSIIDYHEIHPNGPSSNQVFSITAAKNNLWVVFGGYDAAFTPRGNRLGYSHYNGNLNDDEKWLNTPYDVNFPALDLVHITLDPNEESKAYISSWSSGVLVVENDEKIILLDNTNSGLEALDFPSNPNYISIRINGSAFDNQGNLWIANAWVANRLKKMDIGGNWSEFDLSPIITDPSALGLTELVIDKSSNTWIGSRRNGALVHNESGDRKRALTTEATKGSLPDLNVRTLAVDRYNRIWLGTQKGLVVFSDASVVFDTEIYDAEPVIIEDDGVPKKLLGDQPVNTIAIDGAENKWFGTDTGGAIGTNPSGSETLFNFNKDNSPLPSNRILKIQVDDSTGKVYFATDKGIVAFNNNVAPYGESLEAVYAYPNPVKKEHEFVTIDGRHGTHLPKGTNVKILDVAGRLVHESNVEIGQELKGGKIIWNKTNLAGHKVASGVYIVLLTSPDKSETASTKIAIIN